MSAWFEGYAIVPPISPWYEPHRAQIEVDNAHRTIGRTPGEAWRRHCRMDTLDTGELSRRIQHWHDRGYRVRRITLEVKDPDE